MQCAILLYAAGTSYDLRKTYFSSLEGGRAMGAMMSGSALSHKGKKMALWQSYTTTVEIVLIYCVVYITDKGNAIDIQIDCYVI